VDVDWAWRHSVEENGSITLETADATIAAVARSITLAGYINADAWP
jgi:hypothetical protein